MFQEGFLVHQTAPTNIALGEVAKRLVQIIQESNVIGIKNVLLVGNGDRIMQHSNISSIFLEDRFDRVLDSFTGFNDSFKKIRALIQDTSNVYIVDESKIGMLPTSQILVAYIKENGLPIIEDIFGFITIINRELPDNLLSTIVGMSEIIGKYETLQNIILDSVTLKELRQSFSELQSHLGLDFTFSFVGRSSFSFGTRKESEKALKLLKQEFIESAKIIFSTVNCAGRYILKEVMSEKQYVIITDEGSFNYYDFSHSSYRSRDDYSLRASCFFIDFDWR